MRGKERKANRFSGGQPDWVTWVVVASPLNTGKDSPYDPILEFMSASGLQTLSAITLF
jgi:hypothetical protein